MVIPAVPRAGGIADGGVWKPRSEAPRRAPFGLVDTSVPDEVVGTGTPASCGERELRAAVARGGVITFDCGLDPVTIGLTESLRPRPDRNTVIDGGGLVTLDAGGRTRHLVFECPGWMDGRAMVVLQRLVLENGRAPLGPLYPRDPTNPVCAYGYKEGSGGAVLVRNGVLHVVECEFRDNRAAPLGPDVGGGAIYALGAPALIVVGSRFVGNRAANGGAIGVLYGNPAIYDSVFDANTAEGRGMNFVATGCPTFNHPEQGGAGGNGGAIAFDGTSDSGVIFTIDGSEFHGNRANELGGAFFRTPDNGASRLEIRDSLFDRNTGRMGGVAFIQGGVVTVRDTTVTNNSSSVLVDGRSARGGFGGLWINQGTIDLAHSVFSNNRPDGLVVERGVGIARDSTFMDSPVRGVRVESCIVVDSAARRAHAGRPDSHRP